MARRAAGAKRPRGRGVRNAAHPAAALLLLAFCAMGCVTLGDHEADVFTYQEINSSAEGMEVAAELAYRSPRTVEKVERSLELALNSITSRNEYRGLWQAARACAWLAECHPEKDRGEYYARRGIAIAREAVRRAPHRAEPYYYLAVNLGRFSGIRKTSKFIGDMARSAATALEKDERFERAGPHRFLGLLHLRTEGKLLVGFGDLDQALRHLERAVELFPDDAENRLAYAEALIVDESYGEARKHLEAAASLKPAPDLADEHQEWLKNVAEMRRRIAGKM